MEISGTLYSGARTGYDPQYTWDVVFATRETGDLTMQIFTPVKPNTPPPPSYGRPSQGKQARPPEERRFPLVVGVPGSGWGGADGHRYVPHLVDLARAGFVAAGISYRGTFKDDVRFPAAVQDTLEAIRFLRANADTYLVDAGRVALLGDSSGGHTAAMAALAGDDARMRIGDNLDQPTSVCACVIYYGPNDLLNLLPDRLAEGKTLRPGEGEYPFEAREIFQDDFLRDPQGMLADASPINRVTPGKEMPPFLFLQGDRDPIIPLAQGERFCRRVRECGGSAEFYKIIGGGHTDGCWTPETMDLIVKFLHAV